MGEQFEGYAFDGLFLGPLFLTFRFPGSAFVFPLAVFLLAEMRR
jgi:hypothetical protein